jgi:putative ABC transport system permease protein
MMRHLKRAYAKCRNLFGNSHLEEDLRREIATHLALLEDEFKSKGLLPDEARLAARRAYGGVEQAKQRHRDERTYQAVAQIAQDVRYAFHQLRRAPGFTIAAVLTLALGIGANSAIFSIVNAVLLKPLSYPNPDRIVQFMLTFPQGPRPGASVPDFRLWHDQTRAFEDISAYDFDPQIVNLTDGAPEQLHGVRVTADYFRLFGASLSLGRTFTNKEDSPNAGNFVVISYGLWKRTFAGDPNIVGRAISLGNEPFTVVGVTSQRFHTDPAADLWLPFQFDLNSSDRTHYFMVAGRLKPGITLEQANAQLRLAANQARRTDPLADPELGYSVQPLRDYVVSGARSSLFVLGGAVGLVLLIACANVANLLLIRATGRRKEFAIRSALGAGRRRILCQLLTESVILSSAGGLLGLVLGVAGVRALVVASPGDIPRIGEHGSAIALDWRVLVFTLGLSVFTGILFGIIPAVKTSRADLNGALKEGGNQQSAGFHQNKARSLLAVGEISLAVVLLIGAALLIRTLIALGQVNPGFDPHHVLLMDMSLSGERFANTADVSRLVRDARQRINAIPGVEASAMTSWPPLKGRMGLPFIVVGRPLGNRSSTGDSLWVDASPGYFEVFKIPLLRGRDFTAQDDAASPHVVLINESMAKRYWPNQDPIGQQIIIGKGIGPKFEEPPRQIIGIVGDTRDFGPASDPLPTMMVPEAQVTDGMTGFSLNFGPVVWLIRTRAEPHQTAAVVAGQLRQASGGLPVGHIRTMDEALSDWAARQKFDTLLLTIFAAVALILAAIGIYGVLAYSTAQRTREIGIRLALGADRANIRNWILGQGILLAIPGALIGVGAALGVTRLIASLLFGVRTRDPMVFAGVPVLLTVVALLATWAPARRAARLDPIQSLRLE